MGKTLEMEIQDVVNRVKEWYHKGWKELKRERRMKMIGVRKGRET
jgi:hypothetical protein